ncbi:uncharacterized protein LOC125013689 isoform X1 [Mugil cephalus]|uniref:uncharacterized protein LOC125013689 isoform X1 n=1 Tax=Mugil cephalus TaxID=48193 RepID=UPI001FB72E98|nr:uncharacterized protein LOC125013689 isoform X1 [Mugil cephalus]
MLLYFQTPQSELSLIKSCRDAVTHKLVRTHNWSHSLSFTGAEKMFGLEAKAVMRSVGAHKDLISNDNLNNKVDLLTLVKVREGNIWKVPKYTMMTMSLPELMEEEKEEEEETFSPDVEEEVLVKDFTTSMETSGSGSAGGGDAAVGEAKVSANVDTVDGLVMPVSMMKKKADIKKVRSKFSGRKIKKNNVDMLDLKQRDKLTFVHQTVYNTGPVKLIRKSKSDGSISASCQKMINLLVKGSRKEETSFTVPEQATFAYGLTEIMLDDNELSKNDVGVFMRFWVELVFNFSFSSSHSEIKCEPWTHKTGLETIFSDSSNTATLRQVKDGVEMKEALLQPLADLPESTRRELLKKLCDVLKNQDDLSELEETLDQSIKGTYERPQNETVSSFLDVLDVSNVSSDVKNAVYVLVSALDALPNEAPPLLTSCSEETLRVLQQMVDALKDEDQAELPESLPPSLQEDGDLRWAAELLCSTDQNLEELSQNWERPEFPPQMLLEVLCLTVQGLVTLTMNL